MNHFAHGGGGGGLIWPWINNLIPTGGIAGSTVSVTIYGSGFNLSNIVSVIDADGNPSAISVSNVVVTPEDHINATFLIPSGLVPADYGVVVTDPLLPDGGLPMSNVWPFTVYEPITPQIMFNGVAITGNQPVVVGQQIPLSSSYTIPPGTGVTVNSQSWTVDGMTVGGYNAGTYSGQTTVPTFNTGYTTFYWATPGSKTVKFTLSLSSGQSPSVTTTFTVNGVTTASIAVQNYGNLVIDQLTGCTGIPALPALVYGNIAGPMPGCPGTYSGTPGITFTGNGTPPPNGGFLFVHLITSDTITYTKSTGPYVCAFTGGLDGSYPYQGQWNVNSRNDAPFSVLITDATAANRSFSAIMHLMWRSNLVNAIPVPLGYVELAIFRFYNQIRRYMDDAHWKWYSRRIRCSQWELSNLEQFVDGNVSLRCNNEANLRFSSDCSWGDVRGCN